MSFRSPVGPWILAIAALHTVVGVVAGWPQLLAVADDGFVGAVEPEPMRMALFWFLAFGVPLAMVGGLVWHLERIQGGVPTWFGVALLMLGLGGGLAIPASGFWLVLPLGVIVLRRRGSPAIAA